MDWRLGRLGLRAAVAFGLAAVVFAILSNLQYESEFALWPVAASMLFMYVALGASVLTLVRLGMFVAWRRRHKRTPPRREGALLLFRGHAVVALSGLVCLAAVMVPRLAPYAIYSAAEVMARGFFFAGLFCMSMGWAFGSLGNAPGVARAIETSGA